MEILINILIALGACVLLGLIFGAVAVFAAGFAPETEEKAKKRRERGKACASRIRPLRRRKRFFI